MTVITRQPPSCARLNDLAAERRLPDARRAAHQQRRRPAARDGAQLPDGIGELDLATDEHPLTETERPRCTGHTTPVSRHRAARRTPGPGRSAGARYQRMATCRWSASIAARISSRHAASSVGSTSIRRSQSALRRSSSVRRAWTRRRGSWVHASYGASGNSSPAHSAATFAQNASPSGSRSASSAST